LKRKNENGLTDKEQKFCDLYLVGANGIKAHRDAGFAAKTANSHATLATRLLNKVEVQSYLNKRRQSVAEKLGITAEKILAEFNTIGMSKITDYGSFGENGFVMLDSTHIPLEKIAAIQSIKTTVTTVRGKETEPYREKTVTEFKLWDKIEALSKLGEHIELFKSGVAPVSGFHITVEHIGGQPRTAKK
jgi:phage terminase small subunit